MKKITKGLLMGASFYGVAELGYQIGKGNMLGILAKYEDDIAKKYLSEWKTCKVYPMPLIIGVANLSIKNKKSESK